MGLEEKKEEIAVQISEKKERKHLLCVIKSYLETSKCLMEYYKAVANTKEGKSSCSKSIKSIEKALNTIEETKHIEILKYIYSMFIGNNAIAYSVSGKLANSKVLKKYDTEEGIVEFREMLKEQAKQRLEREQDRINYQKAQEEAKRTGKKLEMFYDPKTKKTKAIVVEKGGNA